MPQKESEIARLIDHTLLKPEASREDIQRLCEEAIDYGFASVCVNPWNVSQAAELVRGTEAVSYTHLDVYKRQTLWFVRCCAPESLGIRRTDLWQSHGVLGRQNARRNALAFTSSSI